MRIWVSFESLLLCRFFNKTLNYDLFLFGFKQFELKWLQNKLLLIIFFSPNHYYGSKFKKKILKF